MDGMFKKVQMHVEAAYDLVAGDVMRFDMFKWWAYAAGGQTKVSPGLNGFS